jgi:hypothetical protein
MRSTSIRADATLAIVTPNQMPRAHRHTARATARRAVPLAHRSERTCRAVIVVAVALDGAGRKGDGARRVISQSYRVSMSEIPLDQAPGDVAAAAHDAARGKVVYLTEHGERLAAIVPADLAAELENLTPEEFRELLEDFADAQAAREALAEIEAGASPVPADRVWAELGLDS